MDEAGAEVAMISRPLARPARAPASYCLRAPAVRLYFAPGAETRACIMMCEDRTLWDARVC